MTPHSDGRRSLARIFAIPAVLALASLAGLVGGLLGNGGIDTLADLALGVPVAVIAWALARRK